MENQCKCGSLDFFIEKQGNNTGLYCSMCGKWQKWLNKDEIRLFEYNHKPKNKSRINQTNADKIRSMSDEELAEFINFGLPDCSNYCPDFKAGCSFGCKYNQGNDVLIKWLQSEAE